VVSIKAICQQVCSQGMTVNDDPIIKVLKQVLDRKTDDRIVVIVAHGLIELMINTLVDKFCKHGSRITSDDRNYPYSNKLIILNEKGVLSDPFFGTLDRFRGLRNAAAHDPFFKVDGNRIKQIAEPLERGLPPMDKMPSDNLGSFCSFLIQNLWSQFHGVLGPAFAPSIHQAIQEVQKNDT